MEVTKMASISSITEGLHTMQGHLLRVETVVLLSAAILGAMVMYSATRRPSRDRLLRGVMWAASSLSYVVVSYTIGLIQDGPFHGETFVLWTSALLLIQASAFGASRERRHELDQQKKQLLQHVFQTGLVLWLIINVNATGRNTSYRPAIWAFWSLNVLNTFGKIVWMIRAALPNQDRSVRVVAVYMDYEEFMDVEQPAADPMTMKGYKYLFHGEDILDLVSHEYRRLSRDEVLAMTHGTKGVVTIDQVYRWIDAQDEYSEAEQDMVREMCLAFALFKLLKRRFYRMILAEAGSAKSLNLVLAGLITTPGLHLEVSAFRVVEAELSFLYDALCINKRKLVGVRTYICIAVMVGGLTIWTLFYGTFGPSYHHLHLGVRNLDRFITAVMLVTTAALELGQALAALSSKWRYTKTVYRCVRDGLLWSKKRRGLFWWKGNIAPPDMRYWDDKIGEYVFLDSFDYRPLNVLPWLTLYVVKPRRAGQMSVRPKELPPQVRRAVLSSLKASRGKLTNGVFTMIKYGLGRLTTGFPNVTEQILVWHVVTTRFDWAASSRRCGDNRLVATKLSNYCGYLVAFVPEMLPDPAYIAEEIFDTAVQQARGHLAGCSRKKPDILDRLDKIEADLLEGGESAVGVIHKAALLGGQLKRVVPDEEGRWAVLAEFWAEFILFLAPSDNVDVHAEMLGAGGEFMTQLWALLTHAGILDRPLDATSSPPRT